MTDRRQNLVEPEGVNSGSAKDLLGGKERDPRPGGDPSRAAQGEAAPSDPAVVQPPWDEHDEDAPSLEQSREEGAR
jgi:hypothetical protein